MLPDQILNYILIACLVNTTMFLLSSYLLFVRYGLPIYHIMGFYQLYHFLGFVVRPWELYFRGFSETWDWVGAAPDSGTILWATFVLVFAHLAMIAGFVITNPRFGPVAGIKPINFRIGNPTMFAACVFFFLILGAYSSYTLIGGLLDASGGAMGEVDAQGGIRTVDISGYQTVFSELLTITMITLFAVKRTRKLGLALTGAFIGYRVLAGTGRSAFVAVTLAIGFIWLINRRMRLPTPRMVGLGLALLLIFNIVGADRNAMRRVFSGEETLGEVVTEYFGADSQGGLTQNMGEFDVYSSILSHVPDDTGYTFGTQYLRLLIWPIPRFLWPNKPVFTSIINMLDYGNYRVLTYTLYADSYMTFGVFGMIIILFGISIYINRLYRRVSERPTPLITLIYFVHLIYATILFRDGPVSAIYFYLVLGAGAFALCRLGNLQQDQAGGPGQLPR